MVFRIDGYFVDDHQYFADYLATSLHDTPSGYTDEDIFFYGVTEDELDRSVASGEVIDGFIVTDYRKEE